MTLNNSKVTHLNRSVRNSWLKSAFDLHTRFPCHFSYAKSLIFVNRKSKQILLLSLSCFVVTRHYILTRRVSPEADALKTRRIGCDFNLTSLFFSCVRKKISILAKYIDVFHNTSARHSLCHVSSFGVLNLIHIPPLEMMNRSRYPKPFSAAWCVVTECLYCVHEST